MVQEVNVPTKYLNKLQKSSSDNILHNRVLNDFAMNPRTIERQKKEHKVSEPVNIPFSFFLLLFQFFTGTFLLNGSKARTRRSTM